MLQTMNQIVLEGKRIRLEPLAGRHIDELFAVAQDDEIWRYLAIETPRSREDIERWMDETLRLAATGSIIPFAIIAREGDRAIGSTRYMEIARTDRGIEIGWTWLGRAYWRTGINVEAKYLLLRHAFEVLGAIRVQIKTDLRNVRSQTAIEALGAVREGVLRHHRIVKEGYRRSSVYYSILEEEWPSIRARLEARADADHR